MGATFNDGDRINREDIALVATEHYIKVEGFYLKPYGGMDEFVRMLDGTGKMSECCLE